MAKPFFSIILCTRNRPELIENILFSLRYQDFQNFEVVLSDNSDPFLREKNLNLSKKYYFNGLKYIETNRLLSMHDHYNFAIEHVSGEYIGILTDKSLLKKNALQTLYDVLNKQTFDIVNYQHTGCLWYPKNFWTWISLSDENNEESELEFYNPKEELERRFSFKFNRSHSGKYYNFGKLFFGFYHRSIIQKVKKKYGKLFHHFSPDYNSTVLALSLSLNAAYHPKNLVFAVNNYAGNGSKGASQVGATEEFIKSCGVDFETAIAQLPIPNVYTAHNFCAYDYEILNRFGQSKYKLNLNNLAIRVAEDMKNFPYKSQEERGKFEFYFGNFCKEKNIQIPLEKEENKNGTINISHAQDSIIDSLIRFFMKDNKLGKITVKSRSFWNTHHRRLSDLLDA